MAEASVTLSLPQMIDYAVSYPESGSVNFVMLHSLLHVLIQQLELLSCNVEFKGKESEIVQGFLKCTKEAPKVTLTEFVVTPPKDAGKQVHRGKKETEQAENVVHIDDIETQDLQTVVVVETQGTRGESEPMIISKTKIEEMQRDIQGLKKSLKELSEMPANQTLISAIRQVETGKGTPVLEIFQSVSLVKRLEATDAQVQKLGVMLEDLIKSNPNLGCPPGMEGAETLCDRLNIIDRKIANLERSTAGGVTLEMASVTTRSADIRDDTDGGKKQPGGVKGDVVAPSTSVPDFTDMDIDEFKRAVREQLKLIKAEIKMLYDNLRNVWNLFQNVTVEEIIQAAKGSKPKKVIKEGEEPSEPAGTDDRLTELESVFQEISQQIASLDTTFNNEFQNLQNQFAEMEKEFGSIMEKIHIGMPGGEGQVSGETIGELYEKILGIQTDMESLADTATKLMEDKDEKEKLMDLLTEQIDMLKTIKADKEDLEDALADKADACAINRKVSHDQFDTACDELSKGIEEALTKLTQQERLWQSALDEIQREIGNKLDRMELGPLRDFINQKLKVLQQRLKALTALKQETEAAGTKKFLKNVQCISCDKDVVMRKELDPSVLPQPYALPPSRSMGPYLAYELDALRKQQKALPGSRNLNHFESAMHGKTPRPGDDHICNRYCGGSHTITTPQQRVTRLGHFLNQWGPDAQPVCDMTKDDESPLIVSGRGTDRKSTQPEQPPAKPSKESGETGSAATSDKKDSKEPLKKGSAEMKEKKSSASKISSKVSAGTKTSATKVPTKSPSASSKSAGKRPSQTSARSAQSVEKQGSKTSKTSAQSPPKVLEDVPEAAEISEATEPVEPAEPAEPVEPVEPAEPAEPAEATEEPEHPPASAEEAEAAPAGETAEEPTEDAPVDE